MNAAITSGISGVIFLMVPHLVIGDSERCFDFSTKIVHPLRDPIAYRNAKEDFSTSGTFSDGFVWGAARGIVNQPILTVIKKLMNPLTVRNSSNTKVTFQDVEKPGYFAFQRINIEVNPFLFINIEWVEEWAFSLIDGDKSAPRKLLVLYQKSDGTSHIEHLCGSIVLQAASSNSTDAFLYEEVRASRRNEQDTANGLMGTLRTLRELTDRAY